MNSLRVLIIEDEADDVFFLEQFLKREKWNVSKTVIATMDELKAIDLSPFELVISDYMLDGFDASFVIEHIRTRVPELPIIILSGRIGEDIAVSAMKAGAWDYIMKEKISLLGPAIHRALDLARSRREMRQAEEELIHAKSMETTALLSFGVLHDLNNIINAFDLNLEILQSKVDERDLTEVEKRILSMQAALKKGIQVSRQLLDMSKQHTPGEKDWVAPLSLITKIKPLLEIIVRDRATLVTDLERETAFIKIDVLSFDQILINLVSNAKDAVGEKGVITVSTRLDRRAGEDRWVLKVSDNGKGIPLELQPKIFNSFFSTKGRRGTGLGLSLVKKIIDAHAGDISLTSAPGQGTSFEISFPCLRAKDEAPAHSTRATPKGPTSSPRRVLVIDDEDILATLIRDILIKRGHQAQALVGNFEKELATVDLARFDHCIIDLNLAHQSGLDMADLVRRKNPKLSVIMISGLLSDEAMTKIRARGFLSLGKPFGMGQLLDMIEAQ